MGLEDEWDEEQKKKMKVFELMCYSGMHEQGSVIVYSIDLTSATEKAKEIIPLAATDSSRNTVDWEYHWRVVHIWENEHLYKLYKNLKETEVE